MVTSPPPTTILLAPYDSDPVSDEKFAALAMRTGLTVVQNTAERQADFSLLYKDNQLTLQDLSAARPVDVCVDFCGGKNRHRQHFGGGLGQPLARAVNARALQNTDHIICDATGGFGRDALVFATLGCRVVLLEQSAVVYELLADGIRRAREDNALSESANRMEVFLTDSTQLPQVWPLASAPHTIYLDPMYPQSGKQAAAKKEMQILKRLLPHEPQLDGKLLAAALHTASNRVVVKRPKSAPAIDGAIPVGNISSTNTRFDLYHPTI